MKVLVIGTGSIGKRHIKNCQLLDDFAKFALVRKNAYQDEYSDKLNAIVYPTISSSLEFLPDFAIIATPSAFHMKDVIELICADIPIFVEKPLVTTEGDCKQLKQLMIDTGYNKTIMVGTNLRYLPIINKVKNIMDQGILGQIIRCHFEAGLWLPDWRPSQDYRSTYSASMEKGGGVLFDLIHEIDIAHFYFGEFVDYQLVTGKFSSLEIESNDVALIHLFSQQEAPIISIALDYISRDYIRKYSFVGDKGTLELDIANKGICTSSNIQLDIKIDVENDYNMEQSYVTLMKKMIDGVKQNKSLPSDFMSSLAVTQLVAKMQASTLKQTQINVCMMT